LGSLAGNDSGLTKPNALAIVGGNIAISNSLDALSFTFNQRRFGNMGKGDRRTKRGKIWRGTTGASRPKKKKKTDKQK
jgi:30S ribosomal protein S31